MLTMKSALGVYVGYESFCDESKVVSRAWFRELAEPWRVGSGVRVRIGTRAVQVGRCRRNHEVGNVYEQLGGRELEMTPDQIGAWSGAAPSTKQPHAT